MLIRCSPLLNNSRRSVRALPETESGIHPVISIPPATREIRSSLESINAALPSRSLVGNCLNSMRFLHRVGDGSHE